MEDSATSIPSSIWASLNSWFTSTVFFILLNLMIATIVFTSNLPNNNNNQQEQEEQQKQNSQNDQNQPQIARSQSILHRLKSFNFYPRKTHHESEPDTHHHQDPIEIAATQYVFNQPIHYQHFDFDSTNSDQFSELNHEIHLTDTETRVETVTNHFDFDPTRVDTSFGFDPTRVDTSFDFDPTHDEHTDGFQSLDEVYSKLKGGGGGHHDRTKSAGELPSKPPAKSSVKMKKSESMKEGFSNLEKEEILEARRPATVRERKTAVKVVEDDDSDDDVEVDAKADDFINKFKNDLKLQRIESIIRTKGAKK